MVFLGTDETVKDYLETTDVLPTLQAAVEAMLRKMTEQREPEAETPDALNFIAEWLKRHNPRHNAEFAEVINQMRAQPGYGGAEFGAAAAEPEAATAGEVVEKAADEAALSTGAS